MISIRYDGNIVLDLKSNYADGNTIKKLKSKNSSSNNKNRIAQISFIKCRCYHIDWYFCRYLIFLFSFATHFCFFLYSNQHLLINSISCVEELDNIISCLWCSCHKLDTVFDKCFGIVLGQITHNSNLF